MEDFISKIVPLQSQWSVKICFSCTGDLTSDFGGLWGGLQCASLTLLEFGHQIYVEIVVAGGGGGFLLLVEDADHMIVQSQSVGHSEVTQRTLVGLRHVDRLAGVLTWWRTREALHTSHPDTPTFRNSNYTSWCGQLSTIQLQLLLIVSISSSAPNGNFLPLILHSRAAQKIHKIGLWHYILKRKSSPIYSFWGNWNNWVIYHLNLTQPKVEQRRYWLSTKRKKDNSTVKAKYVWITFIFWFTECNWQICVIYVLQISEKWLNDLVNCFTLQSV